MNYPRQATGHCNSKLVPDLSGHHHRAKLIISRQLRGFNPKRGKRNKTQVLKKNYFLIKTKNLVVKLNF